MKHMFVSFQWMGFAFDSEDLLTSTSSWTIWTRNPKMWCSAFCFHLPLALFPLRRSQRTAPSEAAGKVSGSAFKVAMPVDSSKARGVTPGFPENLRGCPDRFVRGDRGLVKYSPEEMMLEMWPSFWRWQVNGYHYSLSDVAPDPTTLPSAS